MLATGAFAWRTTAQSHDYRMPDEDIPLAVIHHVRTSNSLDTNWARTAVPEPFRYHQFNFSSYHLAAALLAGGVSLDATLPPQQQTRLLRALRWHNALLGALGVVLLGLLTRRVAGGFAGLCAAALMAVNVTLFQDALYARPEAFVTVLTLCLVAVASRNDAGRPLPVLLAGVLSGLLLASKISFLLPLPFVLAALLSGHRDGRAHHALLLFCVALGGGFVLGAPYALLAPAEFLHGVGYLFNQYGGQHWPHGLHDGTLPERLGHAVDYLLYSAGPLALLAAAVGTVWLVRKGSAPWQLLCVGIGLGALYAMQSRVFFERNLSHALPLLFLLAGAGLSMLVGVARRLPTKAALAAVVLAGLLLPPARMTWLLSHEVLPQAHAAPAVAFEETLRAGGTLVIHIDADLPRAAAILEEFCGDLAFRALDYGDRYTRAQLRTLPSEGVLEIAAHFPSPFAPAPASTLYTYHGAGVVFLRPSAAQARQCRVAATALPAAASQHEPVAIELDGEAARDAHEPGAVPPAWARHVFATWNGSDSQQGSIRIVSRLCDGDLLPLAVGPQSPESRLHIDVERNGGWEPLYSGPVPSFAGGWIALRIAHGEPDCPNARLTATDPSTAWGSWIGIGAPARPTTAL